MVDGQGCSELLESIREAVVGLDSVRAAELCDRAVREYPDSPEVWAVYGYNQAWRGDRDESHAAMDKAVAIGPESAMAWAARAFLAGFDAQGDEAVEYAKRALELDDQNPWVLYWCIDAYHSAGETETCLDMAERWYHARPDELMAVNQYYDNLYASGKSDQAYVLADEAEQRFPLAPSLVLKRARKFKAARQLTEAIDMLRSALARTPGSSSILSELAVTLSHVSKDDEAEKLAMQALEISSISILAMQAMQNVWTHRGNKRRAQEWRERTMDAIPVLRAQASLTEATAAIRREDWKTVLRVTEPVLSSRLRTTRKTAIFLRTRALIALKRYDEAAMMTDALAEIDPNHHDVFEYRAEISRAGGRLDDAVEALRSGLSRFPTDGKFGALLLRTLHEKGAQDEGNALIEAIRSNPPDFPAGLSEVYMALNDTDHPLIAHEILKVGRERFPDSPELKLFEAVDKLTRDDPSGARKAASDISGEFRGVAGKVEKAAGFIEQMRNLRNRLLGNRKNDKPGPMN